MSWLGTVRGGVIVPDDAAALPREGTRVRIEPVRQEERPTFGELFADLKVNDPELPTDLAAQHDHYRLGTPKR